MPIVKTIDSTTSSKRQKGVTILEIAVVMVVVGLGIALLFPALQSLRRKATQANCASNLRQIGVAIFNYANTQNGRLPRWNEGQPAAPLTTPEYEPTGENKGVAWSQMLVDGGFIGAKSAAFICPSNFGNKRRKPEISYSMNARVADHRLSSVETPAKLVVLTERYETAWARRLSSYGWAALVGSAHVGSGHNGVASFVFLDGHAEVTRYVGDPSGKSLPGAAHPPADIWHLPEVPEEEAGQESQG